VRFKGLETTWVDRRRARPCRAAAAFTLLELLVVLSIIALLAGVIVPRMDRSVSRRELDEAAGRFAQTARTVRELAVARHQPYAIEMDLDGKRYAVVAPSGRERQEQWRVVQASWMKAQKWPETVTVASYKTPDGTRVEGGRQYLRFFPDGSSTGVVFRLVGRQEARDIVVHPHSGRVVYGDAKTMDVAPDQYDLGD